MRLHIVGSISLDLLITDEEEETPPAEPSLPDFENVIAAYGLNNFNPVGYPAANGVNAAGQDDASDAAFREVAPHPLDWNALAAFGAPFLVNVWDDQNSQANNLTQHGGARPTLQITTPVVVSGAGTAAANGTYTYRGQFLDNDSDRTKAFYVLAEQPTSENNSAVAYVDSAWKVTASDSGTLYHSADNTSFPWQAAAFTEDSGDSPAPTVAAGTQSGEIVFDGVISGLQSSNNLTLNTATTIYCFFKLGAADASGVLFEIGPSPLSTDGGLSAIFTAGVLQVAVYDDSTVGDLRGKVKTVGDTDWHLLTIVIDTAAAGLDNQVLMWLDGSTAGVTNVGTGVLDMITLSNEKLNVGARNNGASNFLACSMTELLAFSVAQDTTLREQWQDYINSL